MPGNTRGGETCQIGPQKTNRRLVRVKRWCKRPPARAAMPRPGNPHQEQGQTGTRGCSPRRLRAKVPGRPLELPGDGPVQIDGHRGEPGPTRNRLALQNAAYRRTWDNQIHHESTKATKGFLVKIPCGLCVFVDGSVTREQRGDSLVKVCTVGAAVPAGHAAALAVEHHGVRQPVDAQLNQLAAGRV